MNWKINIKTYQHLLMSLVETAIIPSNLIEQLKDPDGESYPSKKLLSDRIEAVFVATFHAYVVMSSLNKDYCSEELRCSLIILTQRFAKNTLDPSLENLVSLFAKLNEIHMQRLHIYVYQLLPTDDIMKLAKELV